MGSYHDMQEINAKSSPKKGAKVLRSVTHERSSNGGHIFEHRFKNDGPGYHEPETHSFGADEGKQALAHFAKHVGLTSDEVKPDADSAAGAAT